MLAFIVQARLGSTRLPNKILLPFYKGKSIFELLLEKLTKIEGVKCVVATSKDKINDRLEDLCEKYQVPCFRGSENNVLQRFIEAAQTYGIDRIIRVCSDNPFLNVLEINRLIKSAESSDADYISFDIDGTPSIRTHFGFWTEYVTTNALYRIISMTDEPIYLEHVTNYIYTHPDSFKLEWLSVSSVVKENKNIRLTIDTYEDFENAKQIYSNISEGTSLEKLISLVKSYPHILQSMHYQINLNSK